MLSVEEIESVVPGVGEILGAFTRGFAPPAKMLTSDWADKKRVLDSSTSKEAGPWNTARTPYLREPMDAMSPYSPTNRGTVMKGAQVGATEGGMNIIGAAMDVAPCPIIVVFPTGTLGERWSKMKLAKMIELTPELAAKVPRKGDGNTITLKEFPGGVLAVASAASSSDCRSMSACLMIFEEVDEFPRDLDDQGDAMELVCVRGSTFMYRRKEFINCTPTLEADSIVFREYLAGTQEHWEMPCPHSPDPQNPHYTVWHKEYFRHVRHQPDTAHFVCRHCQQPMRESVHKTWMLDRGRYVAQNPAAGEARRSWYIPSSLSPEGWLSWAKIATRIDDAHGNYARLKVIENTVWGLPWKDATDSPDPRALVARARAGEFPQRMLPPWVVMLTCGVDLGTDHMELGIWGWGRDGRRHAVEQVRLRGRPNDPTLWQRLETALTRVYEHPRRMYLPIRRVCIDRGYATDLVDAWAANQDADFVTAVKGIDSTEYLEKAAVKYHRDANGKAIKGAVASRFSLMGADLAKLELYNALNIPSDPLKPPPSRWITFANDLADDWFDQLVGEEWRVKINQWGRLKGKWAKKNIAQRVEALDCANLARVAAVLEGYDSWLERDFDREFANLDREAEKLSLLLDREMKRRAERGDKRPITEDYPVKHIVRPGDESDPGYFGVPLLMDQLAVESMEDRAAEGPAEPERDEPAREETPFLPGMVSNWGRRTGDRPVERQDGPGVAGKAGWGGKDGVPLGQAGMADEEEYEY